MAIITSIDCVLPRPDISTLQAALKTELSRRLLGGAPVLPMSSEDVLSFVMAGTVNLMHGFVTQALKENDPATMCCDNLITYGARHGIDLRASKRAKGYVEITGDPGAPVPGNIRFIGSSSLEYKLDPGVWTNPTVLDANGAAELRVVASLAGTSYNLPAGTTLTVSTTLPGIDGDATIVGPGMTGGTEDETCDEFRARVIAAEASGAVTTNMAWYLGEAGAYPGVTRVCSDECEGCCDPSFMTLYPFFEGTYGDVTTAPYGVPPGDVLCEMTEWMFGPHPGKGEGLAPVGMRGVFALASPIKVSFRLNCYDDCPGVEDRVKAAMPTYLHNTFCVGSKICLKQVEAAAMRAIGVDACVGSIDIIFERFAREDCGHVYLYCGDFPVMGDVFVNGSALVTAPC